MNLSGCLLLLAATVGSPQNPQPQNPEHVAAARRLAATTQLAAQEYRIGVVRGQVVSQAEVDEARLFLQEARRSARLLPPGLRLATVAQIDSLVTLVARTGGPDSVDARVRRLATGLASGLGISLEEIPAVAPSLLRGGEVYQTACASCHGESGRGDGPAGQGLDPAPADLTDPASLRNQSPLDFFRRVTIGVAGTAMPAFESRLSPEDRWAVALYASTLRLPPARGEVPPPLRAFTTTARLSDSALLAALAGRHDGEEALARVAAVRQFQVETSPDAASAILGQVRAQLDSTFASVQSGDPAARTRAFDAYMAFEQVERPLRAKNPGLVSELEASFARLRIGVASSATPAELEQIRLELAAGLEQAERTLGEGLSPPNLFVQSFVILLREGLEAILVVGALLTFLAKLGASRRRRDVHIGVGAAIGASILTAVALETMFQLSPAHREALEGVTVMLAAAVLFYVSYWLLSKMEVAKWTHFVRSKVQDALSSGSVFALASAAFLAVYREGFETVLFYKALFVAGGPSSGGLPVFAGIAAGGVVLVGVYLAITRFGVRLPLKPFFAVTSAFLYYMAFVFAGKGVAELQEGGLLPSTILPGAPRVPALGIYPTAESLATQGVLVILLLVAIVWIFLLEPTRRGTQATSAPPANPAPTVRPGAPNEAGAELVRSLERMQSDLAEIRAELEQMREHLAGSASTSPPRHS